MKTNTEINLTTFKQRMDMLTTAPAKPVSGRGFERVELTDDSEIVDFAIAKKNPHFAVVSVRKPINRFGKIGYPKSLFTSPEFASLFA